jgi:3-hydroxyisobutyrate dehydrogenase-like beta-hydroxyacid dehydrogenase
MATTLAFIGFGEAGQAICSGLAERGGVTLAAWDILFDDPKRGPQLQAAAAQLGVRQASDPHDLFSGADVVLSMVTTDQSLVAAEQAAPHLPAGLIYLDLNSTSPGKKRKVAATIESAGGHFVEAAVMNNVLPSRHRVPLLLAGDKADTVAQILTPLDMDVENIGSEIGQASAIKMCRSVFMKGLAAILFETLLAARKAGADARVLASIGVTIPGVDWAQFTKNLLVGTALHARRRAGEMHEVTATLRELDIVPVTTPATADSLQAMADMGMREIAGTLSDDTLATLLDRMAEVYENAGSK